MSDLCEELRFAGRYGAETEEQAAARRIKRNNAAADEIDRLRREVESLRAALVEAEEYIAQHSQANGIGLRDHDHDRYERFPLLEKLRAAIDAARKAPHTKETT